MARQLELPHPCPVTCITEPDAGFHWFGYYDKLQFSPDGRLVLAMRASFEGRMPGGSETIDIGVIDLAAGNAWTTLGDTRAWCWQQGCMLQWAPRSGSQVIWNDREGEQFVARVHDLNTGHTRTLPRAVYALSNDGRWAVGTDFRRLNDMRPGYGYPGIPDPNADRLAPDDTGIWRIDLESGDNRLIFSLADAAALPWPRGDLSDGKHYFNHLLINPDDTRIELLHRWYPPGADHWLTRMLTIAPDGSDPRIIDDSGHCSHFIWQDADTMLAACKATGEVKMCRIKWRDRATEVVDTEGLWTPDGHFNIIPHTGARWLATDGGGGPMQPPHQRPLYLLDQFDATYYLLGQFQTPPHYKGPQRIDLHPRVNNAGTMLCIDSAHEDRGRQLYTIDISALPIR